MVHKSSLIPGLSKFIDDSVLSHYPPTSMKRIIAAGAISLYLKQNEGIVDTLTSSPLVAKLGVVHDNGMIDLETVKDIVKSEINKAGFMRLSVPMMGNIDFTTEDVDLLYKYIMEANSQQSTNSNTVMQQQNNNLISGVY